MTAIFSIPVRCMGMIKRRMCTVVVTVFLTISRRRKCWGEPFLLDFFFVLHLESSWLILKHWQIIFMNLNALQTSLSSSYFNNQAQLVWVDMFLLWKQRQLCCSATWKTMQYLLISNNNTHQTVFRPWQEEVFFSPESQWISNQCLCSGGTPAPESGERLVAERKPLLFLTSSTKSLNAHTSFAADLRVWTAATFLISLLIVNRSFDSRSESVKVTEAPGCRSFCSAVGDE